MKLCFVPTLSQSRKMQIKPLLPFVVATLASAVLVAPAAASITASYQVDHSSASFYDSSIGVNLLTSGQSSLSSVTNPQGSLFSQFPKTGVNDGSAATSSNDTYYSVTATVGDGGAASLMPDSVVFQLTQGYDITSIKAFSGWGDHNLGEQNFELMLSVGGGAFTSYGTFVNAGTVTTGNSATGSYLTTLTDTSGIIASNVTGIKYIFSNPDTSNGVNAVGVSQLGGTNSIGGTVIRELEAFGTPTAVPEPTKFMFLGLASACMLLRRRRS